MEALKRRHRKSLFWDILLSDGGIVIEQLSMSNKALALNHCSGAYLGQKEQRYYETIVGRKK